MARQVENLVNDFTTSLDGGIDNSVTAIVVAENTTPSDLAVFRIRIDDELMRVTANFSTTWVVERGVEGTVAVAHDDEAPVYVVLTAAGTEAFVFDRALVAALALSLNGGL